MSPTVLRSGPYRFFFYSSDCAEPAHVHVVRERKEAKFWLVPVSVAVNVGFAATELTRIAKVIDKHHEELLKAWHDYFKSGNGHGNGD